jgi:chloride channel protein, CIC family
VLITSKLIEYLNKARLWFLDSLAKLNLPQDITFLVIASFVGIAAGYGAVIFHEVISVVQVALFVDLRSLAYSTPYFPYIVVLFPAIGGLAVGVINVYISPESKGHGVPDVMKAVIAKSGYIKSSLVIFKTIASGLSIGSGGGAGREGPIVQIGASIGSGIGQFFKMSSDRMRTLVACGAGGGIAAIFNAPMGGVMFALEIIIGDFSVRTFSPIVISCVLATAVSRSYLGDHPTFVATSYHLVSNYELFFYVLLGIIGGAVSVWFTKTMFFIEDFFHKIKKIPKVIQPAVGGLLVGVFLIWFPSLAGFSYDINNQAILGNADFTLLAIILLCKPIVTGLTLGSGGSGGVFAPSLKAGAALGGAVGIILHTLLPHETAASGAYALVGMGALVAGTMHAPLTAILIMFEVANTYQIILPIMFAAVSSTIVAKLLLKQSIYTLPLVREGIEVGYGINLSIVHRVSVSRIMKKEFVSVHRSTPMRQLIRLVEESDQPDFPVTDEAGHLVGVIRFQDIRPVYADARAHEFLVAEDIMMKTVPSLSEYDTLDKALKTFEVVDLEALPVVDGSSSAPKLIGMLSYEDALRLYRKEILLRAET